MQAQQHQHRDALHALEHSWVSGGLGRPGRGQGGEDILPRPAPPRCPLGRDTLLRLGLRPCTRYFWLHIGPIGPSRSPLLIRDTHGHAWLSGGIMAPTWAQHRGYQGWHLDLLVVTERPYPGPYAVPGLAALAVYGNDRPATPMADSLWVVYAQAWRTEDGPLVSWEVGNGKPVRVVCDYGPGRPTVRQRTEAATAERLVLGERARRQGRKRMEDLPGFNDLVAQIADLERNGYSQGYIARKLRISARQVRHIKERHHLVNEE